MAKFKLSSLWNFNKFKKISRQDKTRILVELSSFDKGGLEKVALDTTLAFDKSRYQSLIVTTGPLGHLAEVARRQGLEVIQLSADNVSRDYRALLRQYEPHIAISHFSHHGYPFLAERNIPIISFIHNVYAFLPPDRKKTLKYLDAHVSQYIAVSPKVRDYAAFNIGLPEEKIVVIPNGLIIEEHERRDKTALHLSRESLGLVSSDYVFVHPASYNLHKGHYVIARAMQILLTSRRDIKVVCVGNEVYAPHAEAFRKFLADNGLTENIKLPGYIPEIQDAFKIADACLLPSFIEGWSIAMNEAMFYGKPLILTDTGGASEVIHNNDIGILLPTEYPDFKTLDYRLLDSLAFEPRDYRLAPLLAEAMASFADNREKWFSAGLRGRDKIYESYDFSKIVLRYEAAIDELTQSRRGQSS
ncbi:glycosyltransferase family 4 protein [Hyphomicrobium sp. 802]|uniref:glycosyltransferase family 4 protein n=1 Tax=Hyphomicrobium sp. 802 TaxID=1112272 RepID=UPI00045E8727|nr:glycosyltransferase family 4 protein [Hyphomicrobium sp. 802]